MTFVKKIAVAAVTMFATANGQEECSAEQNACIADADCLAIFMSGSPSCSGGCVPGMEEVLIEGEVTQQPDGSCVTPGTATVDDACTYTAPVEGADMMTALNANTLGAAYMACANPVEPCPHDASRPDSMAVYRACSDDTACRAKMGQGSPTQASLDAGTW